MMLRHALLIVLLFPALCLANNLFTGQWRGEVKNKKQGIDSSMSIWLKENQGDIVGRYCLIYNQGERIDCTDDNENNISGRVIKNNKALLHFDSWFGEKNGEAEFTVENDQAEWKLLKTPRNSQHYIPKEYKYKKVSSQFSSDFEKNTFETADYTATVANHCGGFTSLCDKVTLILIRNKDKEVYVLNGRYVANNKEAGKFIFHDEGKGLSVTIDKNLMVISNNGETYSSPGKWNVEI
ncbi:hypothetical protein [Mixta calida]|uniref:hypothetical protein n=1 Tax=Mixta calida TaxID=665913 RepID=UPI00289D7225|nr:hypothetical protein [Mixta calida]MDU4288527.1 hypothetical protein [Mixta calida]